MIGFVRPRFLAAAFLVATAMACTRTEAVDTQLAVANTRGEAPPTQVALARTQAAMAGTQAAGTGPEMIVYATPTCGCCGAWIDHMREAGFMVDVVHLNDLTAVRREYGLPPGLVSCHTGIVEGFVVEGHVPAAIVMRLLDERPPVLGIAVPGMPIGSPGMEHPTGYTEPYEVHAFDAGGPGGVYARID